MEGAITLFSWVAAIFAMIAALLWMKASTVSVDAPKDSHGVGALLGGLLVSEINGKRIDLHKTLEQQSRWNSNAALAAFVSASSTGVIWILQAWPGMRLSLHFLE